MSFVCQGDKFGHKSENLLLRVPTRPGLDRSVYNNEIQRVDQNFRKLLFLPARYLVIHSETPKVSHEMLLLAKAKMLAYLLIKSCCKVLPLVEVIEWNPSKVEQCLRQYQVLVTQNDQIIIQPTRSSANQGDRNPGLEDIIYNDFLRTVGGHSRLYRLVTDKANTIKVSRIQTSR